MSLPLYLVSPSRRFQDIVRSMVAVPLTVFDSVRDMGALSDRDPGVLLLDAASVPEAEALTCAAWVARIGGAWCVGLVEEGGATVRSLSLGPRCTLRDAADFAGDPPAYRGNLLDLPRALADAGRLRHDLNNPLTTAMVETELLLGDEHGDDVRESLELVQRQLLRIRDLITAADHLTAGHG